MRPARVLVRKREGGREGKGEGGREKKERWAVDFQTSFLVMGK